MQLSWVDWSKIIVANQLIWIELSLTLTCYISSEIHMTPINTGSPWTRCSISKLFQGLHFQILFTWCKGTKFIWRIWANNRHNAKYNTFCLFVFSYVDAVGFFILFNSLLGFEIFLHHLKAIYTLYTIYKQLICHLYANTNIQIRYI